MIVTIVVYVLLVVYAANAFVIGLFLFTIGPRKLRALVFTILWPITIWVWGFEALAIAAGVAERERRLREG